MENNSILQKLDGLEARFEEVSTLITDPEVIADQNRFVKLTKEYKDLGDIMDARKRYIACLNSIREAKDILANESDPEMKEMAREELATNEALQPKLEEEIKIALIPKDPEDAKNVQMEIRAGTGGDEACLFAGDLFKMYKSYCDSKGWQLSISAYLPLKRRAACTPLPLPLPYCLRLISSRFTSTRAKSSGTPSVPVVPVVRTSTRWNRAFVCAICGRTRIRARRRKS